MPILAFSLSPLMLSIICFVAVSGFVIVLSLLVSGRDSNNLEDRLEVLTGKKKTNSETNTPINLTRDLVRADSDQLLSKLAYKLLQRFEKLQLLFHQADAKLKPEQFIAITVGAAILGVVMGVFLNVAGPLLPFLFIFCGSLPYFYLVFCRSLRFKRFGKQLPDAMELIARALRSGHSLASAIKVVVDELPNPISQEFNIAYEEQNLGIPVEQSLKNLYTRMPNLDYKFFAMAVAIQRQSGGDLAEILDKIGHIIRERFRILGQVQALTGEGRISGIVLMVLPLALFFAVWQLNPEYVMLLFTDPLGKQMVAVAVFLQILGAITIKKIITIKV